MIIEPVITFRNMEPSPKLEEIVLNEAKKLERFFSRIVSCRVAIEGPPRQEYGQPYRIRIDLGVPGEELLVDHNPTLHGELQHREAMHETKKSEPHRERRDADRAIRDTFHEMRRQLQDYVRRRGGQTEPREKMPLGKVTRLSPEEDCGFIESDGREIYFHRNSVLGGHFDRLRIGAPVHFAEEKGEKGPQASTVKLVRAARQGRTAAATVLTHRASEKS